MRPPPRRRSRVERSFLDWAIDRCEGHGFQVLFSPTRWLSYQGGRSSGFFSASYRTLEVATSTSSGLWFETFLHELGHFEQHLAGLWSDERPWSRWDAWIHRRGHTTAAGALEAVRTIQACERDAERRALRWIRLHDFPTVDRARYTRIANAYVLSYEADRRRRSFKVSNPSTWPARLLAMMPDDRLVRRLDVLPPGYMEAYE